MNACPGCGDDLVEGKVVCDDCMIEVMEGEGEEVEQDELLTDEEWEALKEATGIED